MNTQRRLCYLGDDGDFFETMAIGLANPAWSLEWCDGEDPPGAEPFDTWDWRRVLLVDLGCGAPDDVERLERLCQQYAGVPWIAIADGAHLPLTTCALARLHGAEAMFYKPCDDWENLAEVVQAALARIANWEQAMDAAAALNAA